MFLVPGNAMVNANVRVHIVPEVTVKTGSEVTGRRRQLDEQQLGRFQEAGSHTHTDKHLRRAERGPDTFRSLNAASVGPPGPAV